MTKGGEFARLSTSVQAATRVAGIWSGGLDRNSVTGAHYLVEFIKIQQFGLVVEQLDIAVGGIGTDDDAITYRSLVCSGSVHGNDAGTGFAPNGIGCEALAIGDVVDLDLLEFANA